MKDLQGYISPRRVKQIIDSASSLRDRILVRLLWVTGCRVSELVGDKVKQNGVVVKEFKGVQIEDVVWEENVIIMDTLKRKRYPPPKRRVEVDDITMRMLKKYVGTRKTGKLFGITRQRVFQIIRKLGQNARVGRVGNKGIHPHHFRHSHCVAWIRDNNNMEGLRKLQERLKHASITTTTLYLQFAGSKKEVEKTFGNW